METLTYLSLAVFVLYVILLVGIFLIIKLYDRIGDLKDIVEYRETIIESKDNCIDDLINQVEAYELGTGNKPLVVDVECKDSWVIRLYLDTRLIFEAHDLPSLSACKKAVINYLNKREV